jgi:hypothetical protein
METGVTLTVALHMSQKYKYIICGPTNILAQNFSLIESRTTILKIIKTSNFACGLHPREQAQGH